MEIIRKDVMGLSLWGEGNEGRSEVRMSLHLKTTRDVQMFYSASYQLLILLLC